MSLLSFLSAAFGIALLVCVVFDVPPSDLPWHARLLLVAVALGVPALAARPPGGYNGADPSTDGAPLSEDDDDDQWEGP